MSLTLDINLWTQKWHKVDAAQQRDFLLMQLERSQEASFKDIPLIMMSLITEHHLKALALNAAVSSGAVAVGSPSVAARQQRIHSLVAEGDAGGLLGRKGTLRSASVSRAAAGASVSINPALSSPNRISSGSSLANIVAHSPQISYALHNKQFNFVTPDLILKEVWALLKPSQNDEWRRTDAPLPADFKPTTKRRVTSASTATSAASSPLCSTLHAHSLRQRNEFQMLEDEYYAEEEKREVLRVEAIKAKRDVSNTIPNPLACDIMDGWTLSPQQISSRREVLLKAENALIDIATRVVCGIRGVDPYHGLGMSVSSAASSKNDLRSVCGDLYDSTHQQQPDFNQYAVRSRPSVPKAVRWLAHQLLHSIMGYDVLTERHDRMILENFDGQWNAVTPLAAIMDMQWASWAQRRVKTETHSRRVHDECHTACFTAALDWQCKECMIVGACANFALVLFALWVSPKWDLSETLPESLMAVKMFSKNRDGGGQTTTTGLLLDYLNVKSVYDDVEGAMERHIPNPSAFTCVIVKHLHKIIDTRMPDMKRLLQLWSEGPLELEPEEDAEEYQPTDPKERVLLAAVRSWLESLFMAPTPPSSHYDVFRNDTRLQPDSPRSPTRSRLPGNNSSTFRAGYTAPAGLRPNSPCVTRSFNAELLGGSSATLMSEAHCSLFWRHFIAFGWPFVIKLCLQVLHEASAAVPLLVHSKSPQDLSAYALAGGAASPTSQMSIYNTSTVQPFVSDPKLEAMLRKMHLPANYAPLSLLEDFKSGPDEDYFDVNDLRVMQKAFMVSLNRLPASIPDLGALVRRVDQWDQVVYESLREETDDSIVDLVRKWDQLFICAQHAKKKTRSILQAIGLEVDEMERILPMAPENMSRY